MGEELLDALHAHARLLELIEDLRELLNRPEEHREIQAERDDRTLGRVAAGHQRGPHGQDRGLRELSEQVHTGEVQAHGRLSQRAQPHVAGGLCTQPPLHHRAVVISLGGRQSRQSLLEGGVDFRDLGAGASIQPRGNPPEDPRGDDDGRHEGQDDGREREVSGEEHDGDAHQHRHRRDRLRQPRLQERRQRVDVRGQARHDLARRPRLEPGEIHRLHVPEHPRAQREEQPLAGEGGEDRIGAHRRPAHEHHAQGDEAGGDENPDVTRGHACVEGAAHKRG